jgi:hypothetical protein
MTHHLLDILIRGADQLDIVFVHQNIKHIGVDPAGHNGPKVNPLDS